MENMNVWQSWRERRAIARANAEGLRRFMARTNADLTDEQRAELKASCDASERYRARLLTPREVLMELPRELALFELPAAQQARVRRSVSRKLRGKGMLARREAHRIAFDTTIALMRRVPSLRAALEAKIALRGVEA